jgi:Predicted nucleotide kinase
MDHLFLEGPVRTGKSTLLLECIFSCREYAGGFCCIRLTDTDGNIRGFRLAPPDTDYREQLYDGSLPDIFLESGPDGMKKHPEVFETSGIDYLRKSAGKKFILLDEIGGFELMSSPVRSEYYSILGSGIPCIGVIKSAANTGTMIRRSGFAAEIAAANAQFRRDLIADFQAEIIEYSSAAAASIRSKINSFMDSVTAR